MTATLPGLRTSPKAAQRSRSTTIAPAADVDATEPNYVSIYVSSILAVTMLFLVGVGVPISMYLSDWSAGFGLGAFCAFWGGPSFGVMVGAARVSAWQEAHTDH